MKNIYLKIAWTVIIIWFFLIPAAGVQAAADKYEPDNSYLQARVINQNFMLPPGVAVPGYEWHQIRNFYNKGDTDWVKFYALADERYEIVAKCIGKNCDTVIELYDTDGKTLLESADFVFGPEDGEEVLKYRFKTDGTYFARVRLCDPNEEGCEANYGEGTEYDLQVTQPYSEFQGLIYGKVTPKVETVIRTDYSGKNYGHVLSRADGLYFMPHEPGPSGAAFHLTATAPDYKPYDADVYVTELGRTEADIALVLLPPGQQDEFDISGWVITGDNIPLCAMVLANGQFMFTCEAETGRFDLTVPADENGEITLFAFCDGLAPFKAILKPSQAVGYMVKMVSPLPDSPTMKITKTVTLTKQGWAKLSGQVLYGKTPLCALVLANGQHMFSPEKDGKYELEVPLDSDGKITLFGFADGFLPFKLTFQP